MEKVVLSLFDGMSCGQLALNRAGISYDKYYASEIDKHAIKVTQHNFPDTIQLGSVVDVKGEELPSIWLLCGGSPCQSFSFAGKRKGMSTKCETEILTLDQYLTLKNDGFEFEGQSYLFWEYMRILKEVKPKYFLLENVMMGEKWERILSKAIGVNPIEINSALVSAQNRRRLYWTNIGMVPGGLFGDLTSIIQQPKDKGILLKDILESEVDSKYFLSEKALNYITNEERIKKGYTQINGDKGIGLNASGTSNNTGTLITESLNNEKSTTLDSSYYKGFGVRNGKCRQVVKDFIKIDKNGNIKSNQDKASCFTAGGHSGGNHSDMDLIVHNTMPRSSKTGKGGTGPLSRNDGKTYCLDTGQTNAVEIKCAAMRGREAILTPKRTDYGKSIRKDYEAGKIETQRKNIQQLEPRSDNKTNTLTSVQKDNLVIQLNPSKESGGKQPYQQNRVYDENGIAPCLDLDSSRKSVYTNSSIRRLTPTECERLQTVPDSFTAVVSDSQRYRMLGNGWTISVIAHIFSYIK